MLKASHFFGQDERGIHAIPLFGKADAELEKCASSGLLPDVVRYIESLRPSSTSQYVLVNAMGASEWYGSNINGDAFPEASLIHLPDNWTGIPVIDRAVAKDWGYGFPTFYNAHPYAHHRNKDASRAFGTVELATWNPNMKRVELVVKVDHDKCVKFGGVGVWDKLRIGEYPDVSMGTKVPYDTCSICLDWDLYREAQSRAGASDASPGQKILAFHREKKAKDGVGIRGLSVTRNDYCVHAKTQMSKIYPDGRKVWVYNDYPRFFDISFVFIGADKTAKVMLFVYRNGTIHSVKPSAEVAESLGAADEKPIEGEKVGFMSESNPYLRKALIGGALGVAGGLGHEFVFPTARTPTTTWAQALDNTAPDVFEVGSTRLGVDEELARQAAVGRVSTTVKKGRPVKLEGLQPSERVTATGRNYVIETPRPTPDVVGRVAPLVRHVDRREGSPQQLMEQLRQDAAIFKEAAEDELLKSAFGKLAKPKRAEIDKDVMPSQFTGKAVPLLTHSESDIPRETLNGLGSLPLANVLSTLTGMGMLLRPREYQRITLIQIGKGSLADEMDAKGEVFEKSADIELVHQDRAKFSAALADLMLPYLADRSALGPVIEKRILVSSGSPVFKYASAPSHSTVLLAKLAASYNGYRQGVMELVAHAQDLLGGRSTHCEFRKLASAPTTQIFTPLSVAYLQTAFMDEFGVLQSGVVKLSTGESRRGEGFPLEEHVAN